MSNLNKQIRKCRACIKCDAHQKLEAFNVRRERAIQAYLNPPPEDTTSVASSIRRVDRFESFWDGEFQRKPIEILNPKYRPKVG